ncbi:hypothetical protein EYV94_15815 [Puteibacter caeruleilacunae]|nr:hypothetical protein EYV94_15815 [Puteibacter caeruleilacunae]
MIAKYFIGAGLMLAAGLQGNCMTNKTSKIENKPNIIYILVDDLGYGELGCYGQDKINTPVVDQMAKEGMKFTNYYAGAPVCAPSRCVLLTGKHLGHSFIRNNKGIGGRKKDPAKGIWPGDAAIPTQEKTIAEYMKEAGYATGAIGKWGLGIEGSTGHPNKQGFDYFYGYLNQVHAHSHYPYFLWENDKKDWLKGNTRGNSGIHSQDKFDEKAENFIRTHKDEPFFLYYPIILPHTFVQANEEYVEPYKGKFPALGNGKKENSLGLAGYAGMVSQMDAAVGKVLNLLKELNIDDNTLVIFTSDNGASPISKNDFFKSTAGLRGKKRYLYEGGIKTPMIARWPGKIKAGSVCDFQGAFWDVLPTCCELAGVKVDQPTDGISFVDAMLTGKNKVNHDHLYWEFPNRVEQGQAAIIKGTWKLRLSKLTTGNPDIELFELKNDPYEKTNLKDKHPNKVKELIAIMKEEHSHSELFPSKEYEAFLMQN